MGLGLAGLPAAGFAGRVDSGFFDIGLGPFGV